MSEVQKIKSGNTLWGIAKEKLQKAAGEGVKITNQQIVDAMKAIAKANGQEDGDFDAFAAGNFDIGNEIQIPGLCIESSGKVEVKEDEVPATGDAKTEKAADEAAEQSEITQDDVDAAYKTGQWVGAGKLAAGAAGTYALYKGGKAAYPYVKAKVTKMGAGAKKMLKAAGKELKNNKFKANNQTALNKAKANAKATGQQTVREIQGKNAAGKKVNTSAAKNVKNGYLNKNVRGNARTVARNAAKRKLVANPKATAKAYGRAFKAGSKAATASKAVGVLGRTAVVVGVALEGVNIYSATKKEGAKGFVKQTTVSAAALGTAWAGGKAGAAIGAVVGGPVGAVVGGVIGGVGGYLVGTQLGKGAVNLAKKIFS